LGEEVVLSVSGNACFGEEVDFTVGRVLLGGSIRKSLLALPNYKPIGLQG
jgi:hypothetical protein